MGAILESLQGLQEIEKEIAAINTRTDAERRRVKIQRRALDKHEALVQEKTNELQNQQLEIDRIDLDVKSREEQLNKHREALNRAKSNKEYAAILTSINTEKADSAKLESRQLQLMTQLDERRTELDSLKSEHEKLSQKLADAQKRLQDLFESTADQLAQLQHRREVASRDIPPEVLTTFNRVATHNHGLALAEVHVLNLKRGEFTCSGCNMTITLETALNLRVRDDIKTCPSCGMILYLDASTSIGAK